MSDLWSGLIASSVLIGIFVGSITCGWLGDRFGRRLVYMLDFVLIVVASAAQFFVHDPGRCSCCGCSSGSGSAPTTRSARPWWRSSCRPGSAAACWRR
ncbi:MFS transporter [Curtobacterium flaccumfaciens]|nr:MFS transporter [Curtobacterium flaccumfaciens]